MSKQILWNIYESVILLEGYLEVKNKIIPRTKAIKRISRDLRKMATNQGIEVDEIYRNENGISYQIQSMDSAFQGHRVYVSATKMFIETVNIYNNDKEKYLELLETAKKMINNNVPLSEDNIETRFIAYLKDNCQLAEKTCILYVANIKSAEKYARNHGFENNLLFSENHANTVATAVELYADSEFVSYNDEQHNRFTAAINKLLQFIGADIPKKVQVLPYPRTKNEQPVADAGIVKVISTYYKYGFKVDSFRELIRFRRFADELDINIPDDDDMLTALILSSGSLIDGKVFCKSESLPDELNNIISEIMSDGVHVIYYNKLFENKNEWMLSHIISSPEMLKEYLQSYIPNCYFAKTFFVCEKKETERTAVTSEIIRVWGNSQVRTIESLSNDLPYIPIENIYRVISGNDFFVLVNDGTYLYTEKLIIKSCEIAEIQDHVKNTIDETGFASLNDVPLGDIEEENYEIPHLAILNAVYKRVLKDDFQLNGWIITQENSSLDAVSLLKKYLSDKNECTFEELNDYLVSITGRVNRQYVFQALYDEMIRIDRNHFVSNSSIHFNISEIDKNLSSFIIDDFVSLKGITTFAMFPVCGTAWNQYVLESFCYKYSHNYSLHTIHFNDKNVGIIAEKSFNHKYDEMLALALARADIDLFSSDLGQYLFNEGYLSKTKYAPLEKVKELALKFRKESR